jgi:hypothetical protein
MYSICKIQTHTVPSLQGTLAKPAKPPLQPNFAKEPFSPSHSNARQRDSVAKINRLNNELKNGQFVTCGYTQYGGCSVFQRLWLVSAFLYLDREVASKPRTAHAAGPLLRQERRQSTIKQLNK